MASDQSPRTKLTVLYDARCSLCAASVKALLKRRPAHADIEPLDLHSQRARELFPHLDRGALMGELHVVDAAGNVFSGARAVHEVLRYQRPPLSWLALLWNVPGYPCVAQKFYRWFSARRYRLQR